MTEFAKKLSPTITNMIRADHTAVLATFHKYEVGMNTMTKRALANSVCAAVEIHAQLEEEIFYPALRAVVGESDVLGKSEPEHQTMRSLIMELRTMDPESSGYDRTFMKLMREVMHHVADEETVLLPEAERLLPHRLNEMGAEMTKRRLQLAAPRAGEITYNMARSRPLGSALLAAGALLAGTYLWRRTSTHRHA
jgi:hemerythrin-like domain-containing protein